MGWTTGIADKVRSSFSNSIEKQATTLSKLSIMGGASVMQSDTDNTYTIMRHGLEDVQSRHRRFQEYEAMDEYPAIATALDLFADDTTQPDWQRNVCMWVVSDDDWIKTEMMNLYHGTLKIEDEIGPHARTVCKYGEGFAEILLGQEGVVGLAYLPPPSMQRLVVDGRTIGFAQDERMQFEIPDGEMRDFVQSGGVTNPKHRTSNGIVLFEDWEVIHWRLRARQHRSTYGFSVVDTARHVWKRLAMMEDALLLYKLEHAPERLAFYIDVGNLPPSESMLYMNQVRQGYKKKKFYNAEKGGLDMRYNPLCLTGDTKIPLLDGTEKTLIEMSKDFEDGNQQWVYSVERETGRIVPGKITFAGKTREKAKIIQVTLDNGKKLRVTPDHKFIRRNGEYVEAKSLKKGDSLMPFYRIISSHKKGYSLDGYEMVFDLSKGKHVYTHRIVARECGIYERGNIIHHDRGKLNNDPQHLQSVTVDEHRKIHHDIAIENTKYLEKFRSVPENAEWLRENARNIMNKWHASARGKAFYKKIGEINRNRDSTQYFRAFRKTEQYNEFMTKHRKAMSEFMHDYWTEERKNILADKRTIKFSKVFLDMISQHVVENNNAGVDKICSIIQNDANSMYELNQCSPRQIKHVHRHLLLKAVRYFGYENFSEFKRSLFNDNHKVVAVEDVLDTEDTYTLTINKWHNFATSAGVFVKNSTTDNLWIPTRDGKDSTRVETVGGSGYQGTEDIIYVRQQLQSALKMPAVYLGFGTDEPAEKTLSHTDVRFARTIMSVQRELRNGYKRVGNIHLLSIGKEPQDFEWDLAMTVPTMIYELAQIEAWGAKAQIAEGLKESVSLLWVLVNIFKFTEDEAMSLMKQRQEEILADGKIQAKAQSFGQEMGGGGGFESRKRIYDDNELLERFMLHGDKSSEKRLKHKLDDVLESNTMLSTNIKQLMPFMADLQGIMRNKR